MAKMKTKRASVVDASLIWLVGPAQTWLSLFELYQPADPKVVQYKFEKRDVHSRPDGMKININIPSV